MEASLRVARIKCGQPSRSEIMTMTWSRTGDPRRLACVCGESELQKRVPRCLIHTQRLSTWLHFAEISSPLVCLVIARQRYPI